MADSTPSTRSNNTPISDSSLKQSPTTDNNNTPPRGRGQRKPHEHIRTSDEELKEFNKTYNAKETSQYLDPCRAQTKASLKCMDENNYDRRRCTRFFKDYSDCKKQWLASLREERRKKNLGIVDDDDLVPKTQQDPTSTSSSTSKPSS